MSQPNIVILVQSLSPVEKQHFKKSFDSKSDFVRLFDYINKYKSYEPAKVRVFLSKKKKGASQKTKEYTSGHISVLKNYLHEKIMESLRTQYIPKRASYDIMMRSLNTDILVEKGLYQLANHELQIAKNKSLHNSFPIEKLLLYRRESILKFYEDYKNSSFEDITDLYKKRIETAEQLILEIKYARILTILSFQYFKGQKDMKLLQSFIQEDYMQDAAYPKEFGTKYLFHWVHAQFAEFQGKPEEAIQSFEKTVMTWLDHPDYIQAHPKMYLGTCHTYLKYILQQKKSYTLILNETDLQFLISKIPNLKLSKEVELKWKQLFLIGQLLAFRKDHHYDSIIQNSPIVLKSLGSSELATDFTKILVYYFIAVAHFQDKDYQKTYNLLNELIYNETIDLRANPEYYAHVFVLYLLIQYELRNYKFLKHEIKKFKIELKVNNQLGKFEEYFFKMLSQLISQRYINQKDIVFERSHTQLTKIIKEENEDGQIEYQMILDWINSRM